jgi:superfamily II DNA/RNA helicase
VPGSMPAADQPRNNRRRRKPAGARTRRSPAVQTTSPVALPATSPFVPDSSAGVTSTASRPASGRGMPSFAELGVPAPMVVALVARGIDTPFPIQAATLPDTLAGRDVLGRGRTGSGKTIAFAVPTVAALVRSGTQRRASRPRALILVPTRELANQVADAVAPLGAAYGLRVTTVFGGVGQGPQVTALRRGVDVLIACPGRLEDLIGQGHCALDAVEVTVLDEADHMADLGFLPAVKRLLDRTPARGQRLLFSATLDSGVDVLVRRYLVNPVTHSVEPTPVPVATMAHHVFAVTAQEKSAVVRELAAGRGRTLLFMRTKQGAKKLAKQLTAAGIPAADLHGNLSQNARERNLAAFAEGSVKVLVATDIAARGIHVDDVNLVVHVDPPAEHKAYLHRSGRTARAGAEGLVVTVMTPDQRADVRLLAKQAGIKPVAASVAPGDAAIVALTGPKAPRVEPTQAAAPQPANRPPSRPAGAARRSQPKTSAAAVSERGPRRARCARRAA